MDTIGLFQSGPILPPGIWDDRGPVDFFGWRHTENVLDAYMMTIVEQTSAQTLSAYWRVDGDGFAIRANKFSGGGAADVCVNGDCFLVDWEAPDNMPSNVFSITGLGPGIHDVSVTSRGVGWINIDAIYVYPRAEVTATPAPELTPEPTPAWVTYQEVNGQPSIFTNEITTGDQSIFLMLVLIATTMIILLLVSLRSNRLG